MYYDHNMEKYCHCYDCKSEYEILSNFIKVFDYDSTFENLVNFINNIVN